MACNLILYVCNKYCYSIASLSSKLKGLLTLFYFSIFLTFFSLYVSDITMPNVFHILLRCVTDVSARI